LIRNPPCAIPAGLVPRWLESRFDPLGSSILPCHL
jgi:hypothetical protein